MPEVVAIFDEEIHHHVTQIHVAVVCSCMCVCMYVCMCMCVCTKQWSWDEWSQGDQHSHTPSLLAFTTLVHSSPHPLIPTPHANTTITSHTYAHTHICTHTHIPVTRCAAIAAVLSVPSSPSPLADPLLRSDALLYRPLRLLPLRLRMLRTRTGRTSTRNALCVCVCV